MADGRESHSVVLEKALMSSLNNLKHGKSEEYHEVIKHLSSDMSASRMQEWLEALCRCVSEISKNHDQLASASMNLRWYDDEATAGCYIEYLTSLLSVRTQYLRSALASLTHHFLSQPVLTVDGCADERVLERVHQALQSVMALVPTASSLLMPLLQKGFPFRMKSVATQELALRNVLYLTRYCPTLSDSIYELSVHQMLATDVELPNLEDRGREEEEEQFTIELDTKERHVAAPPSVDLGVGVYLSRDRVMQNEQAEKLDVMMTVCLNHFHHLCHHKDGSLHYSAAKSLFDSLLRIFELVLLPTHASSCVQFLLFVVASWHEDFAGFFLDFLWEKCQDPNTPAVLRQSAAAYISSFVARSKFVSLDTVKLCLTVVTEWIHSYLDSLSPESMKSDVLQHGPFFSLCQTVFYVFSFRHKELLESHRGLDFLRRLNFERIITSRLNPLKVCVQSVVEVFASLSSRYEIAFCFSILEQNKRIQVTLNGGRSSSQDCFFPFDPYHLKRSGSFIHPLYRKWEEVEDSVNAKCSSNQDDEVDSLASSLDQ